MTVTVCIPAYCAGSFIAETVAAVLSQTHRDLKLIVAIDPPAEGGPDDTAAALSSFTADPRLTMRTNPRRLGWAENVNSLVQDIETPFYCFLPHDDVWSPTYLECMLAALESHPEAIIAYCDVLRFGATPPTRESVFLPPNTDRVTALLHFLIQGTEAEMWRGVTRSWVLKRVNGFPTDHHMGLVVECEYALALLGVGAACHVPRTLYFKRVYDKSVLSASRVRTLQPSEERRAGWQEHDRRMQQLLASALQDMRAGAEDQVLCQIAKEAALLLRFQQFVTQRLGADELGRAEMALSRLGQQISGLSGEIASNLHLVLALHWRAAGVPEKFEAHTQVAWETCTTFASALAQAHALYRQNRLLEALERATEAMRIGHRGNTQRAALLISTIYGKLGWAEARPEAERNQEELLKSTRAKFNHVLQEARATSREEFRTANQQAQKAIRQDFRKRNEYLDALFRHLGTEYLKLKPKQSVLDTLLQLWLLGQSEEFDVDWYSTRYPDVALSGKHPITHYFETGARLLRNPSQRFDTKYYVETYPQVRKSGLNPLIHYVMHGKSERLNPLPPKASKGKTE